MGQLIMRGTLIFIAANVSFDCFQYDCSIHYGVTKAQQKGNHLLLTGISFVLLHYIAFNTVTKSMDQNERHSTLWSNTHTHNTHIIISYTDIGGGKRKKDTLLSCTQAIMQYLVLNCILQNITLLVTMHCSVCCVVIVKYFNCHAKWTRNCF